MTTSVLGAAVAGLLLYALPSGHEPATQLPKVARVMVKTWRVIHDKTCESHDKK